MSRWVKLYFMFLKQNIKVMLEYRLDFIIGFFSTLMEQFVSLGFIWVIFNNIRIIKGWDFYEIVLVYSFLTICISVESIFMENVWMLGEVYIRSGRWDTIMVRPVNPLYHLICDRMNKDGFGSLVIGFFLMASSIDKLQIEIGGFEIFMIIVFLLSGVLIFSSISIAMSTTAFYFVNNIALMWGVYQLNEFALYPIDIFNRAIRIIISFVVPYAFVSYYPASYILKKPMMHMSLYAPFLSCIMFYVSIRIWHYGLKSYSSAGG